MKKICRVMWIVCLACCTKEETAELAEVVEEAAPVPAPASSNVFHLVNIDSDGICSDMAGTLTFVDASSHSWTAARNSEGSVMAITMGGTYALNGTTFTAEEGGRLLAGAARTSGDVRILGVNGSSLGAEIRVLVRKSGTFTNTDLQGNYYCVRFAYEQATTSNVSLSGTIAFDGAGAWSALGTENRNSLIDPSAGDAGTYALAADGTLSVTDQTGSVYQGGLLEGGDVGVAAMTAPNGSRSGLMVFVRIAGTHSSLAGSWKLVTFGYDQGLGLRCSTIADLACDGAGNFTGTRAWYGDGVLNVVSANVNGGYTLTNAGELSFSWNNDPSSGVDLFRGGVSPDDGVWVAASIGSSAVPSPVIVIGIRN